MTIQSPILCGFTIDADIVKIDISFCTQFFIVGVKKQHLLVWKQSRQMRQIFTDINAHLYYHPVKKALCYWIEEAQCQGRKAFFIITLRSVHQLKKVCASIKTIWAGFSGKKSR